MIDLWYLNFLWIPGMNSSWSWCMVLLMYFCIWFTNIVLMIFASMFIIDAGLGFLFFFLRCLWFWHQDDAILVNGFGSVPCSAILWDSLRRISVSLFFKCFLEFICEDIWPWTFVGVFWLLVQFHYLYWSVKVFNFFLIQSW